MLSGGSVVKEIYFLLRFSVSALFLTFCYENTGN